MSRPAGVWPHDDTTKEEACFFLFCRHFFAKAPFGFPWCLHLQCGDPSGTGGGGPGYQFADENLKGATYPRGTVAMANAGPGTNGSQFFLVYADSTLPPNYTPFGTITEGLDLLDTVAKAGSNDSNGAGDGKPKLSVEIKTLRVTPKAA